MLTLAIALQLSTGTAHLGVPVLARAETAAVLTPDLERSTTDLYSVSVSKEEPQADRKVWTLSIMPLAVGKIPITVYWAGTEETSSAVLEVPEPPLPPDAEIADIKEPVKARPRLWPWLLALLAAALGFWIWRRQRRDPPLPEEILDVAPDPRPAHVIALAELEGLEQSDLWSQERFKDFYAALTEILRRYLERRFETPALKLTTAELLKQLRLLETDRNAVAVFRELFDRADLVKFAKTIPTSDQGRRDLEAARQFVRATAPADAALGSAS